MSKQLVVYKPSKKAGANNKKNNRKFELVEYKTPSVSKSMSNLRDAVQMAPTSFSKRMEFTRSNDSNAMRSIKKREFVSSIIGTSSFASVSWNINPGLETAFPWLHRIAADWQQYRFKSFRAIYITRSGSSNSGSVILSPEYNVAEGAPANEQEAVDTQDAVEDVIWKEVVCDLDVKAMFGIGPRKQVRRGPVVSDLATYDAAFFSVCTIGCNPGVQIGKLYFEYEIDFFVPQSSQSGVPLNTKVAHYQFNTLIVSNGVEVPLQPMIVSNPLGITAGTATNSLRLPIGNYRIDYCVTGNTAGSEDYSMSTRILDGNAYSPLMVQSGRTDAYGVDTIINNTVIVGSDGTTDIQFLYKMSEASAANSTASPGANSFLYITIF